MTELAFRAATELSAAIRRREIGARINRALSGAGHDPEAVAPQLHLWGQSRIAWFNTADRLPRYPTDECPKPAT